MENVRQSKQIDIYLTSIVIGQKSTNQIAQYMVESLYGFCTLLLTSGTFGEYSDLESDILTTQRFLDVSRFLYSGGWQVWVSHHVGVPDVGTPAEALPGPAMSYVGFINASRRCQKLNENSFLGQNFRKGG